MVRTKEEKKLFQACGCGIAFVLDVYFYTFAVRGKQEQQEQRGFVGKRSNPE